VSFLITPAEEDLDHAFEAVISRTEALDVFELLTR
jgi:hypothetical protein